MLPTILMSIAVALSNPLNETRENVPVVIEIPAEAGNVKSVSIKGMNDIKWQLDDLNEDGRADELVLLIPSLSANANEEIEVEFSDAAMDNPIEASTAAMMRLNDKNKKHPALHAISFPGNSDNMEIYNSIYGHGAMLEGLWSAIRVYIDNRQSVDLYLKQTPRMELDSTFFYTTADQMDKGGCGRDVLWAGKSVALGSFRGLSANREPVTIDTVCTRSQRVVASGPIRSIIEVTDKGWKTPSGEIVDMTQRYSMFANSRDYDVEVKITPTDENAEYCTGIQKLAKDNEGFIETFDGNVVSGSWGTNLPDQGMPDRWETLGLGIFVPDMYKTDVKEDELNYLTFVSPDNGGIIRYSFTATGLLDSTSPAQNINQWHDWLVNWAKEKANPVKVEIK